MSKILNNNVDVDNNYCLGLRSYFKGKGLLITGSTGFCGKAFLEKVTRSLSEIGPIYLLVRSKRGESPKNRIKELFKSKLFQFHHHDPNILKKVIPIEADLTKSGLGIDEETSLELRANVHLVYHIAACVKFDADFKTNYICNVKATQMTLEFAKTLPNLQCFIHISTAYSNCYLAHICEKVYQFDQDIDKFCDKLSKITNDTEAKEVMGFQPNFYTFTKQVAECVVEKHRGHIKTLILRPSVVFGSVNEPAPGWFESVHGPGGLLIASALGISQVSDWNFSSRIDGFPVDYLANIMLVSSYYTVINEIDELKVYNLSSSFVFKEDNFEYFNRLKKSIMNYPSMYALRPIYTPERENNIGRKELLVKRFFYHTMFAYLIDTILFVAGQKPRMRRIVKKMDYALGLMKYFANKRWTFDNENYMKLMEFSENLDEKEVKMFEFDIRKIDEENMPDVMWLGARRYILHESDSNIPMARTKYKIQMFIYRIYQIFLFYLIIKIGLGLVPIFTFLIRILGF